MTKKDEKSPSDKVETVQRLYLRPLHRLHGRRDVNPRGHVVVRSGQRAEDNRPGAEVTARTTDHRCGRLAWPVQGRPSAVIGGSPIAGRVAELPKLAPRQIARSIHRVALGTGGSPGSVG